MLAIDWSRTKELVTYDGNKVRKVNRTSLLKKLKDELEESTIKFESKNNFNSNLIITETSCPVIFLYELTRLGYTVRLIKGQDVKQYRETQNEHKSDEIDAKCIYELASLKPNLLSEPVTLTSKRMQLIDNYRRFYKFQKVRVAINNQKKSFERYFGSSDSVINNTLDTFTRTEQMYLAKAVRSAPEIPSKLQELKGLGSRIWIGIMATANPNDFPTLCSYLRFCGLVDKKQIDNKFNRHARMLYYLLAHQTILASGKLRKESTNGFESTVIINFFGFSSPRACYDKCKADIKERHSDWRPCKVNAAAMNRLSTFLAKYVYKATRE